jgi:hypothetical protein
MVMGAGRGVKGGGCEGCGVGGFSFALAGSWGGMGMGGGLYEGVKGVFEVEGQVAEVFDAELFQFSSIRGVDEGKRGEGPGFWLVGDDVPVEELVFVEVSW